ncbi:MAG: TRAP transporter substrate-binding protein [Bacillota bacterium]|jgi:tripartite ATP-independent transporter DctP family solute receptor|uniref:TRAP transporter substrate-binding protein n=1 Tax=Bacillaceae TaxID=186817 RepID=UPI0011002279|nr:MULTISPECIES: TRAP transporter substrate-binding protein [Bacillaceae]MBG9448043.1 C4-dicarboxylate ABC transporter substrate-binding protein [Cytobacillus firmus]MCC3649553.1 TRAP transporter substrate-binding protein [Cytobacillus oceanisediminis]MCS0656098.1 TRAP transporter substrate-binding protein [Cytobacillus firmus]MCU1808427.1 TRAP transporter substrate-binding protein [Cytobacillus firmus]URT71297.1 TRAP transporter substrate-binding protein [Cytobacillus firmus]
MRKLLSVSFVLLLALSALLAGCSSKEEAGGETGSKKIKIVAAHNQTSPDNPYQTGLLKFKEVAESKSNGDIEVEVHAGTIGTEESELVEKLKLGAADVVLVSPGFMTQTGIKEIDLLALPYLFDSYEHWEKVVDGEVGEEMKKLVKEKSNNDFKLVGYWSAGVRHYYGKKPIEKMEDLKGLTFRTQTSGVIADYWKETGAIPTSIAWGELYQALQQNVVDSSENSYPYFIQQNHHKTDNGKYITETGHDYTTRFLLVNGKKFDSYTKEQQDILLEAAEASVQAEREAVYAQEEEYKEKAIAEGAVVNEIDRTPFVELAEPMQEKAAKDMGAEELLKKIKDLK